MQQQTWNALIKRIPEAYHNGLTIATITGAEIVLQAVIRMEEELLILRGRTAGSTESGRILVVPYRQINYICINHRLTDPQVQSIFGDRDVSFADVAALPATSESDRPGGETTAIADENAAAKTPPPINSNKTSKTVLLAKLRERLAQNNKGKES